MLSHRKQFSAGDRVKISDSYHWAKDVYGTVKILPETVFLEGWKAAVERLRLYEAC
jgi:hypothetical protein